MNVEFVLARIILIMEMKMHPKALPHGLFGKDKSMESEDNGGGLIIMDVFLHH